MDFHVEYEGVIYVDVMEHASLQDVAHSRTSSNYAQEECPAPQLMIAFIAMRVDREGSKPITGQH